MTQKKSKKTDPIPMDKILEYNEKELRPIANRQIESLKKRGKWTSDMTFNPYMEGWFCVTCYQKNQEFYKTKAKKGQMWNSENYARTPSTKWWP